MSQIAVKFLSEKLGTLLAQEIAFIAQEVQLIRLVYQEVEEIREELEGMQGFLKDADARIHNNEGIKTWVRQVRRIAYEVEDIIDEFVLRIEVQNQHSVKNLLNKCLRCTKQLPAIHELAQEIQAIKRRVMNISHRRSMYELRMVEEDKRSGATIRGRQNHEEHFAEEADIIGFDKDAEILIKQLEEMATKFVFISVVGMGGSGKTTLIRKIYNDPKVKALFDCAAWISVSQSFNINDVLKRMLKQFCEENNYLGVLEKMNANDLEKELKDCLQGKRYALVLDDVWEARVWDSIQFALPMNSNGSTIFITTRIMSVCSALETAETTSCVHELKSLCTDAAMSLLCRKAFPGTSMKTVPSELMEVCKSMLDRCEGLPLAIVALGSALRGKVTVSEWEKVNDNLDWQLNDYIHSSDVRSILKLSYNELPIHLKPCFLYCCMFPEDHLIKADKLIKLWVAEGFIVERRGMTAEEVGEDYLIQLTDRNMLQIVETSYNNRIKSCKVYDLMRDLAVSISEEDEFCLTVDTQTTKNIGKHRRVSVTGNDEEDAWSSIPCTQQLRSVLSFSTWAATNMNSAVKGFKLLRVLDLEGAGIRTLPNEIVQLLHLRYLCLRRNNDLETLPNSIGSLQSLQTLDIKFTMIRRLPEGICKLKSLRHLWMNWQGAVQVPMTIVSLTCLQTVAGISASFKKEIVKEVGKLKDLRRFEIQDVRKKDIDKLLAAIRSMKHLNRLCIGFFPKVDSHFDYFFSQPPPRLQTLKLGGELSKLPPCLGSLNNVTKLSLLQSCLEEDPFPSLQRLPNLLCLDLLEAYKGQELHCGSKGFPKLQRLRLWRLAELEMVILEEGCMPRLKQLSTERCPALKMVPQGIQHLKLQEFLLKDMPRPFVDRLREHEGEDRSQVHHIPLITHTYWANDGYQCDILSRRC